MPFITGINEITQMDYSDKVTLLCNQCNKIFQRTKFNCTLSKGISLTRATYCSNQCKFASQKKPTAKKQCINCNTTFIIRVNSVKKFCNQSCSATYNNTHKTRGTRRSKLEIWLETQLLILYPTLDFHFNRKDSIGSELDIYIPTLKLAFELNGIYHYEPIHGVEQLSKIQNNDNRKFQACLEHNIELCIIDTSHQIYFKEQASTHFLNIIKEIIDRMYDRRDLNSQPTD